MWKCSFDNDKRIWNVYIMSDIIMKKCGNVRSVTMKRYGNNCMNDDVKSRKCL